MPRIRRGANKTLTAFILSTVVLAGSAAAEADLHCSQLKEAQTTQPYPTIEWSEITSDDQALACLKKLAETLPRSELYRSLSSMGFILKPALADASYLHVSASWNTPKKGILYYPSGLQNLPFRLFKYRLGFKFWFSETGSVRVTKYREIK